MTTRFHEANTEGYSSADLDELNRRFTAKAKEIEPTLWQATEQEYGSVMDAIAERVLADFDAEHT